MQRPILTKDIRGQLVFLGTGTSVGVPSIGCGCPVCISRDPRNKRTRCAIVLGMLQGNLLVDTPPDLRSQLLREGIGIIHAALFTHEHADHVFGLDDLRPFPFYLGHPIPLYCEHSVELRLRQSFDYAFSNSTLTHDGAVPKLDFVRIDDRPFEVLGGRIQPIRLKHGPRFDVLGFRIGNIAYCTDTNEIPDSSWQYLQRLDVLILDCLRRRPHITHFSLGEALAVVERIRPKWTYLTHISHELDHAEVSADLPEGVRLAYDGLQIPLS